MKAVKLNEDIKKRLRYVAVSAFVVVVVVLCSVELAMIFGGGLPSLGDKSYYLTNKSVLDLPENCLVVIAKGQTAENSIVVYNSGSKYALGTLGASTANGSRIIYGEDNSVCLIPETHIVGTVSATRPVLGEFLSVLSSNSLIFVAVPFFLAGYLLLSIVYNRLFKKKKPTR